jgi:hypothetical protein
VGVHPAVACVADPDDRRSVGIETTVGIETPTGTSTTLGVGHET